MHAERALARESHGAGTTSDCPTRTRSSVLAVCSLFLLPLVWLWPCVFGGRTFVPYDVDQFPPASLSMPADELAARRTGANFDVTEVPVWFLPELTFARDELAAGRLPTWNPTARGGAPLHAHGLIGLAYPPNWLALAAKEPASRLGLVAWCNLALGGLFAFVLLRQLGIGTAAAWLGAVLFELSGPMATNAFFWMRLGSYVWLPLVLAATLRVAAHDRFCVRRTALLAVAFAMPWLAGFPPFAATTTVFAGVTCLWLVGERLRQGRDQALRLVARLGLGYGLGAMLAAPQVLPSLAFFAESARSLAPAWHEIAGQAYEPYGLLGFVLPDAFGHPTELAQMSYPQSPLALLWQTRVNLDGSPALPNYNYTEYAVFVSSLGLVLALLGALTRGGGRRALALCLLGLAVALALVVPGSELLYRLPVVQNVWPLRWLAPAVLFVCWFAALGTQRLLAAGGRMPVALALAATLVAGLVLRGTAVPIAQWTNDRTAIVQRLADWYRTDAEGVVNHVQSGAPAGFDRFAWAFERFAEQGREQFGWWLAAAGALGLLTIVRRPSWRRSWPFAAGALVILQLALHGRTVTHGITRQPAAKTSVHEFLLAEVERHAHAGGITIARASTAPTLPSQLPPGQLLGPGVHDLHFYSHADAHTLQPIERLLGPELGRRVAGKGFLTEALPAAAFAHPLFDLYGVRYVLATEPLPALGPRVGPELRGPHGEFFVHERPNALPRAFTAPRLVVLDSDDDVLQRLLEPTLAPAAQAFVRRVDLDAAGLATDARAANGSRRVRFAADDTTTIVLDVEAGQAPWLVLRDTFLPGWTATVDGREVPVVRANHCQRLVPLPEAACRVVFTYRAPRLGAGLAVSGIAAALLAVWWFTTRRRGELPATAD
jgi:hypothetical protein